MAYERSRLSPVGANYVGEQKMPGMSSKKVAEHRDLFRKNGGKRQWVKPFSNSALFDISVCASYAPIRFDQLLVDTGIVEACVDESDQKVDCLCDIEFTCVDHQVWRHR